MTERTRITVFSAALLVVSLTMGVVTLRQVDRLREAEALQEVLYLPSAKTVKHIALGYDGLMATLYWTRVVQYFGGKHHLKAQEYKLLDPLLDITTQLDPHLLVAYEFGATFLAQNPPEGAGDPQAAVRLVQRGIEKNPEAWRLWYQLGYIYWLELHDTASAAEAFRKGSEVPGALPWMKVMAALLTQNSGDVQTARYLWANIYESSEDQALRHNALNRLRALRVQEDIAFIEQLVARYQQEMGSTPASFADLLKAGYIRRLPLDPLGYAYVLREGRVEVAHPEDLPFLTKGLPPGAKASGLSVSPSK